jgi:ketosteroid isomerase-like protein
MLTAVAVVDQFVAAIAAVDARALEALLHPDVEVNEPEALPYGGVYRGRDAFFGELLPAVVGRFEIGVEDAQIFAGDGAAAARMTIVYTARDTGEMLRMPYVEVYEVRDGLITHVDVFPQDAQRLAEFMNGSSS